MASLTKGIFIVAAKTTPFGAFGGKLLSKTCVDLQEIAARAALQSIKLRPEFLDSVVVGNVLSGSSPDAPYMGRHVALRLGAKTDIPCLSVNRLCGSGFQSVVSGAHEILMGDSEIVLTGGSDSMSQCPFAIRGVRFGTKLGVEYALEDMMWAALTDRHINTPMAITAENLGKKYNITREDADKFALRSQANWKNAQENGYFKAEICPVPVKVKGKQENVTIDEHPKPQTTLETLAKLPPVFMKDGTVTAGSASGICDGGAAVILASESACNKHDLKPLVRLVGYGVAGVDPSIMGFGPVPAIQKLLDKAGMKLNDIDLVDINEAFATQTAACQRALDLNPDILNQCGGAIALGHPLAASGARITTHMTHKLKRKGASYGIGSACIGGGQGIALLLENVK